MLDTIAVAGATGAVGKIIRELLIERNFPARHVKMLASRRSAGRTLRFRDQDVLVEELTPEAFRGVALCIASTPDEVALEFVPRAVEQGCVVVDESAAWRMDDSVPLVVPEINALALADHRGVIASPNCSTTQLVMALKPLHDHARVRRVIVSTYQATSGAGQGGSEELYESTRATLSGEEFRSQVFPHRIAWNLIPRIGSHKYAGYTSEEMKMVWETRKIFDDPTLDICATCVRVPVANCHSESVLVETERKLSVEEARYLWKNTPGVVVLDDLDADEYPMPLNCNGRDEVFIGRVREDHSSKTGLAFWCVSDNLRKGAATNAVQIAELLARGMLSGN